MKRPGNLSAVVIGCGLIGRRRAAEVVASEKTTLLAVVDTDGGAAQRVAGEFGCRAFTDYREALDLPADVAIVATPNGYLAQIAVAALDSGKHVLLEKPMGRNVGEAIAIHAAAQRCQRLVKVGFNHRYHPAVAAAKKLFDNGEIGSLLTVRARYGHGGRPGYENEWRGDPELAGGGELTDQGVHIMDLLRWFAGDPSRVYCVTQSAIWPIAPLEDNGYGVFQYASGAIAMLHTSWTQWKNLFSLEFFGSTGSAVIEGLGRSYGTERLVIAQRKPEGGAPEIREMTYPESDGSWTLEWQEFVNAILEGTPYLGASNEGVAVMACLDACYRSAAAGTPVDMLASDYVR